MYAGIAGVLRIATMLNKIHDDESHVYSPMLFAMIAGVIKIA